VFLTCYLVAPGVGGRGFPWGVGVGELFFWFSCFFFMFNHFLRLFFLFPNRGGDPHPVFPFPPRVPPQYRLCFFDSFRGRFPSQKTNTRTNHLLCPAPNPKVWEFFGPHFLAPNHGRFFAPTPPQWAPIVLGREICLVCTQVRLGKGIWGRPPFFFDNRVVPSFFCSLWPTHLGQGLGVANTFWGF